MHLSLKLYQILILFKNDYADSILTTFGASWSLKFHVIGPLNPANELVSKNVR